MPLGRLRAAGAKAQVKVLLHSHPAAQVSLEDPSAVADLLDELGADTVHPS